MTYDDIYDKAEELCAEIMQDTVPVSANDVGLDRRCQTLLIGDGFVASMFPKALDYYGGFDYIEEGIINIGNMKVYLADHRRVQDVLDRFENLTEE
jgi:hypothetical protein